MCPNAVMLLTFDFIFQRVFSVFTGQNFSGKGLRFLSHLSGLDMDIFFSKRFHVSFGFRWEAANQRLSGLFLHMRMFQHPVASTRAMPV